MVSSKENALNSREVALLEVPVVTRLVFLVEEKRSGKREMRGFWAAGILFRV